MFEFLRAHDMVTLSGVGTVNEYTWAFNFASTDQTENKILTPEEVTAFAKVLIGCINKIIDDKKTPYTNLRAELGCLLPFKMSTLSFQVQPTKNVPASVTQFQVDAKGNPVMTQLGNVPYKKRKKSAS